MVAGGGFAGVETAAELKDFLVSAPHFYPSIHPDEIRMVVVQAGIRILPEISEKLANYALEQLKKHKIEVFLSTRVRSATASVTLLNYFARIVSIDA